MAFEVGPDGGNLIVELLLDGAYPFFACRRTARLLLQLRAAELLLGGFDRFFLHRGASPFFLWRPAGFSLGGTTAFLLRRSTGFPAGGLLLGDKERREETEEGNPFIREVLEDDPFGNEVNYDLPLHEFGEERYPVLGVVAEVFERGKDEGRAGADILHESGKFLPFEPGFLLGVGILYDLRLDLVRGHVSGERRALFLVGSADPVLGDIGDCL